MDIIPAIDIIGGKCVRLEKGDFKSKKIYSSDPVETARMLESAGITRLHLVDLDGAKEKRIVNISVLEKIALQTDLKIDFGGGIRSEADVIRIFKAGASMITGGSIAVRDPEIFVAWLNKYGPDRIFLGADHRNEMISVSAWDENGNTGLFKFLQSFIEKGITHVVCTDIERDGMLNGPSTELYSEILKEWPDIYLVASGGVGSMAHVKELENAGLPAVIIGKAIYEERITLKELENFIIHNR